MNEAVFRVRTVTGDEAYVRPDDGSAPLLRRLAVSGEVPVPHVLEETGGWLLLSALRGVPLHEDPWLDRPAEAASIAADALRRLAAMGITHGDMCLPNILGDPETARLSGILDWRYAGRYDRQIDVASAVWSCAFNGYDRDMAVSILRRCGWPRADAREVERLSAVWRTLVEEEDADADEVAIRGLEVGDAPACDAIVAGLPEWFANEDGIRDCAAAVRSQAGLVACEAGVVAGFLTYEVSGRSAEITWMAVRSDRRRTGIGRSLIEALTGQLAADGIRLLAVKTLSDRDGPYAPYEETRRFYLKMRFVRSAELDIWGPGNPATLLTLRLPST